MNETTQKWDNICVKCNKKYQIHDKSIKFNKIKDLIIFSLQRIDINTGKKNISNLKFYDKINLSEFYEGINKELNLEYNLYAAIYHDGE